MIIINIFSAFIILVITIKLFVIIKNKEAGDEKISKAIDLFIALILVIISWSIINYFFGVRDNDLETNDKFKEVENTKTSSPVRFENE